MTIARPDGIHVVSPEPALGALLVPCADCGEEGRWFPSLGIVVHRPLRKCVVQHVETVEPQSIEVAA